MFQEYTLVRDKPVTAPGISPSKNRDVNGREVSRVLERAAEDPGFIAQLTYRGDEALRSYDLTWQEKAALLSGDIGWIEARLGRKLNARLRTWLDCRLQQEIW
jgi:hypothetical protein